MADLRRTFRFFKPSKLLLLFHRLTGADAIEFCFGTLLLLNIMMDLISGGMVAVEFAFQSSVFLSV